MVPKEDKLTRQFDGTGNERYYAFARKAMYIPNRHIVGLVHKIPPFPTSLNYPPCTGILTLQLYSQVRLLGSCESGK